MSKAPVLDSVLPDHKMGLQPGLDEFFPWYAETPRPWTVSINVRIMAARKLAGGNGLLAPEQANVITHVKGVASKGVRLGNWLTARQAQALLNAPDATTNKGLGTAPSSPCYSAAGCGVPRSPSMPGQRQQVSPTAPCSAPSIVAAQSGIPPCARRWCASSSGRTRRLPASLESHPTIVVGRARNCAGRRGGEFEQPTDAQK